MRLEKNQKLYFRTLSENFNFSIILVNLDLFYVKSRGSDHSGAVSH